MNREQRRLLGIKNTEPVYNIKKSDLEQMKQEVTSNTVDTAFKLMLGIPLMILHDKYGFGSKRLTEFSEKCFDLYDSFEKGYLNMDDIERTILKETGVKYR